MKVKFVDTTVIKVSTQSIAYTQNVQHITFSAFITREGLFNYLGNYIGYYDIGVKLGKLQAICRTINRIFRNKVRRDTKLKFYKVMAVPVPYCPMGVNCG